MTKIKQFWKSGIVGKLVIGSTGLILFCCLCSIPVSMLNPSDPTPTLEKMIAPSESVPPTDTSVPTESPVPSKVDQYMQSYGGKPEVYSAILALGDCTLLQEQFDIAATNNQRETAGTEGYQWTVGYMTAADDRMNEIGCYVLATASSVLLPTETASPMPTPTTGQTALGASCIPNNAPQTGIVTEVVDGDTIKVLLDEDGKTYTVRYIGMDTPESTNQVEYYGAEATNKNAELVYGKTATLIKDVSEKDPYGRLLRYVIVDNVFVNYELVAQGYANTASYPPDVACIPTFQEAEQKASGAKLGLWNPPPTLAPVVAPASGGNAACNCGGPDLDCGNFSTHAQAQACYDYCVSQGYGDVFRLDGSDNDGRACESLP